MKLEIHLSGFGCLLGVTDTLALDPMLVSIRSQAALLCIYEVIITSVVGGQPKNKCSPSYKATKHIKRTFLISDYYWSKLEVY